MRSTAAFLLFTGFFVAANAIAAALILLIGLAAKFVVEDAGELVWLWPLIGLVSIGLTIAFAMWAVRITDAPRR